MIVRLAVVVAVVGAIVARAALGAVPDVQRPGAVRPRPSAALAPRHGLLFGAYVNQDNVWRGNDDALGKVVGFESLLGRPLAIDVHYYDWTDVFPSGLEQADIAHDRIPLISWHGANLDVINQGGYDLMVEQRALELKQLRAPVFLRWGWEMNGNWFPEAGPLNMPDGPVKFIAAWRRLHRIFSRVGATNVVWVWCPNAASVPNETWNSWRSYYPGDTYVDWVGVDGYNWGTTQAWSSWQSLSEIIAPVYRDFATRKPIMIAETASAEAGGDKAAWLRTVRATLADGFPAVKAFIWFEVDKETDWRAESSRASLLAFRSLVTTTYFNGR